MFIHYKQDRIDHQPMDPQIGCNNIPDKIHCIELSISPRYFNVPDFLDFPSYAHNWYHKTSFDIIAWVWNSDLEYSWLYEMNFNEHMEKLMTCCMNLSHSIVFPPCVYLVWIQLTQSVVCSWFYHNFYSTPTLTWRNLDLGW
jgi:hypothetical protein